MKKFLILLLLTAFVTTVALNAQHRSCNAMEHLAKEIQVNPQRALQLEQMERHVEKFRTEQANGVSQRTVITIPVVFHVVWKTAAQNISAAQIQSQLDVLNEDFRRLNSDATNNYPQAADTEIEFCLATVDPNGNATTGITRTQTTVNSFNGNDEERRASTGGHDAWPAGDYLNFWVCNLNGFLGYAQFPGGNPATDGVTCGWQYTGRGGSAQSPFNLGRTATHEVGHWLNLRHIWGDGGCGVDDFVSDTPASDAANYGCATGHTSCGTTDMVENYMDYSDDGCMNLFTQGQKTRMQALFASGGARASLVNSGGCGSGTAPCNTPNGLAVSSTTNSGATASWTAASGAVDYTVGIRAVGTSNWTNATTSSTNYTFSGLSTCTGYETRVRTNCASNNSSYTSNVSFTTTGCVTPCNTPTGLSVAGTTNSGATASWTAASGAVDYTVGIRAVGTSNWTNATTSSTNYTFSGLSTCTGYETRVRTNCASNNSSYTSNVSFTTTGCTSGCNDTEVTFTLTTDNYGSETSWELADGNGTVIESGNGYANNQTYTFTWCLVDDCYDFTIFDQYGDGICCAYGNGSYTLVDDAGNNLGSGGSFGSSETKNFCFGGGGGGGNGCTDNYEANETRGASALIQKNTTINAIISTATDDDWFKVVSTNATPNIKVDLTNLADDYDMELYRGSRLVGYSENPGTNDEQIIYNHNRRRNYFIHVYGYAGANSPDCYDLTNSISATPFKTSGNVVPLSKADQEMLAKIDLGFTVSPNPASDLVNLRFNQKDEGDVLLTLLDATGKPVYQKDLFLEKGATKVTLELNDNLTSGMYFIHVTDGQAVSTERLIIKRM